MDVTIKGIFLKNLVDLVNQKKGDPGIKQLEKMVGDIHYSAIKNYPVETEIKLYHATENIIFGMNNSETREKIGMLTFEIYAHSFIGKTMFSLLGGDIKKAAYSLQKVLNTVTTGMEIRMEDLGPNKVKVIMSNNPYEIEHYKGVYMGALEFFEKEGTVEAIESSPHNYEYLVSWK